MQDFQQYDSQKSGLFPYYDFYKVMSLTYWICSNYLLIPVTGPEGSILDLLLVLSW